MIGFKNPKGATPIDPDEAQGLLLTHITTQVPTGIKNVCDDVPVWIQSEYESPEEMAVRFHHRLVWIHPFPNGNGRHSRLMTNIFLENVLHSSPFTWGSRDLSSPNETRRRYINALQDADNGNYIHLLEFAKS